MDAVYILCFWKRSIKMIKEGWHHKKGRILAGLVGGAYKDDKGGLAPQKGAYSGWFGGGGDI